jgi:BON domain
MSISSRTKFSALSTPLLITCLLLGGLSPAYGQTTVQHEPSVAQKTSPSQTVSSASSSEAAQRPAVKASARRPHAARTSRATHHRTVRNRKVVRIHRYPMGPSKKVNVALRIDPKLSGSQARPVESGGVVLYGTVFDEPERIEAERIAMHVHGVKYVINDLKTTTGQWMDQQVRLNNALLQVNSLQGVSARVIGPQVYLSGQVNSEAEKDRAVQLVSNYSRLEVVNLIRVVPPSIFSIAFWS